MKRRAPCGSWKSPLTTRLMTQRSVSLSSPRLGEDGSVWWLEGRPLEEGRVVLVRRDPEGKTSDVTPSGFSVRTRVHEYGGGAFLVRGRTIFFANFSDQRLYRQEPGGEPRAITPEPPTPAGLRYADLTATPDGRWIICVRETHGDGEPVNDIALVPADGRGEPRSLVRGCDFYSFPRPSPDGSHLAWTEWDHPRMPWDGTVLKRATLGRDGDTGEAREVAGGEEESVFQPRWSPENVLHFVSDRTGWWNLYRETGGRVEPLTRREAEFGAPQWVFGASTYTFLAGGEIVCRSTRDGEEELALLAPDGELSPIETPFTSFGSIPELHGNGRRSLVFIAGSPTRPECVALLDADSGTVEVVKERFTLTIDAGYLSTPRRIEYPTAGDRTAHAFFYPPRNAEFEPLDGERPPLIVLCHGGPTGSTTSTFHPGTQFWTSRGFAVVDVDYGGSTGHGRAYRERLKGQWGVVDTQDCVHAARYLAEAAEVDGGRLAIRGGSAGGYTTLCALVFHDVFTAGASYYGVADLEALVRDTHKFESRYLDGLIGPYPETADLYRERSPIHHTDRISCPVILLQGLEDRVVPPAQADVLVDALRRKGLPFAYLTFEGEQHGFRKAETIRRALEAELTFYARIFGFEPADEVEPLEIENL